MALHFHTLTIKDTRQETPDCISISFTIPEVLQKEFAFIQGQSLTLKKDFGGEEIRRSYSICSSPLDNELRVAIKKAYNGLFSNFANQELKAGDTIEVLPPTGNFYTPVQRANVKNYLAFAAGSGITPVISILKTTLATEPHSNFTIVYGNRTHASIIFKEQLAEIKDRYMDRFTLYHILSRESLEAPINFGRIDREKCLQLQKLIKFEGIDEFFLCGPEEMIFSVKNFLESKEIDKRKIHYELFNTPVKQRTSIYRPAIIKEQDNSSNISVKLDGRTFEFNLDYNSNNILDAALAQGADLPFACKGGVCCTCKARLVEGKVEMEVNYGLEADEVAAGYILTCQSHPRTKKVTIDFDVK
ncbi:MAG: 1,2-phenylacetyl-CoA epoxidase subunit PaaE [Ginsengibacter sp.]